jgi:hypothetical protein
MLYNVLTLEPGIQNTENRAIKAVGNRIPWTAAASNMSKAKAVFV